MEKYKRFRDVLEVLKESGNLRQFRGSGAAGSVNLSSNDYLGVAGDRDFQAEFLGGVGGEKFLFGSTSSRLLSGTHAAHIALEDALSGLFGRSALTFATGYQMNVGILPAIADKGTLILADKLCHASIIDGLRLCNCQTIRYLHHNYEQLAELIEKHHNHFSEIIVVTESIFSMDGDVAPLGRLVELKKRYKNVLLYVDEAHAIGVRGLGVAEQEGVVDAIDLLCGTFGKALGGVGGYVICNKMLKEYLVNRCRTLIFTTAMAPINAMWNRFVLKKLACGELANRAQILEKTSKILRTGLMAKGYAMPSCSHIIPLIVGESREAVRVSEGLQKSGFYALPIRPPTVPEGTSRLRFSLTSQVTETEIHNLLKLL